MDTRAALRETAERAVGLVLKDRNTDYGPPPEDFSKTAALWNAWLCRKLKVPLEPKDVAMMMLLVKVSRLENAWKEDSLVDLIGYALTYQWCILAEGE